MHFGWLLVVALGFGCTAGEVGSFSAPDGGMIDGGEITRPGEDGGMDGAIPDPDTPILVIDTSETNPYGAYTSPTIAVPGTVQSSEGLDTLTEGPEDSTTPIAFSGADNRFNVTAEVDEGLNLLELRATDVEGNIADGNRSLLRAEYLAEGAMNSLAAAIAVSPDLLAAIAGGAGGGFDFDASAFIMPGTPLPAGPCNLRVDSISHDPPTLDISANEAGQLVATVRITNLTVGISGTCMADIPVLGSLNAEILPGSQLNETTIEVSVVLAASAVPEGECLEGFEAVSTDVSIPDIDLDLRIRTSAIPAEVCVTTFGPCFSTARLVGEAVGELAEGLVAGLLEDQLQPIIEAEVPGLLMGFGGLNAESMLEFFGTPMTLGICLTGLEPVDGQLMAFLGAWARSEAIGGAAPGAPYLPTVYSGSTPNTVYLDPTLVGQLLFAAYQGGALELNDITAESDTSFTPRLLAALASGVSDVPGLDLDAPLVIDISAKLAPIVTAYPPGIPEGDPLAGADMNIGIGEMEITISAGGVHLFTFGSHLDIAMQLEPTDVGTIRAVVMEDPTTVDVWLIDSSATLRPRERRTLPGSIGTLIKGQLADLLSAAEIALPGAELGIDLTPLDVYPEASGGGYLEMPLAP